MSKTPTKHIESFVGYSLPKELSSPYKDTSGISRAVYTNVANFHHMWIEWLRLIDEGGRICSSICSLKLHEFHKGYFPDKVSHLTDSLLAALFGLKSIVNRAEVINNQMRALAKLQSGDAPITFTWSATKISATISDLYSKMQKEYKLKEVVTENIAHCRDENLIELYASSWTYPVYFTTNCGEYLFAEFSLPHI